MKKNHTLFAIGMITACLLSAFPLFGQDSGGYETVSEEKLREVLADVKTWTAEAIEFRNNAKNLEPKELVAQANAIRKKFDPVMVLMATTEPPEDIQLAATMLLMSAKGTELSLWHYILATVANAANALEHGDALLQTAISQLNDAEKLFTR